MIKKLLFRFQNWNLSKKLLCAFVLVSILPILIVQFLGFQLNKKNMTSKIDELVVSNLTGIAEQIDLIMEMYAGQVYQIYQDEQIIQNILALTGDENVHAAVAYNQIIDCLKQYQDNESQIRCISIICGDGSAVVYDFQNDSSLNTIWHNYTDLRLTPPYLETEDAPGMVVTDTMVFEEGEKTGHYFHISKRMFDFDQLERGSIATVVMTIDEKILNDVCANTEESLETGLNFIINQDRRVIAYPDETFSGMEINEELKLEEFVKVSGYLRKQKLVMNQYEDPSTGWIFCNAYDENDILREVNRTQSILILMTVGVLIFALILIIYTVRTLHGSVSHVVSAMQEVQKGNLDVAAPVQYQDEIGVISENFNQMTVKVKELIREVGEAKEQQKNAEIRALEAQINPHFLYNTLDSINWMAIEKEEYEISRMIRDLGVILRYSINKSNQMVTVQELSDWLGKYISLQKMRFGDSFSYEVNVEEQLYSRRVHKLLLQPFVENAILHGLKDLEEGYLKVDIFKEGVFGEMTVIIEDNGWGMPPEMVQSFNNREEAIRDDGRSIGLHNAFSRMNMYYGDAASWKISSIQGMGTVITLRIPLEMRGGEE